MLSNRLLIVCLTFICCFCNIGVLGLIVSRLVSGMEDIVERNVLTLTCLSDTHGLHLENKLKIPDADVLVFAGDAGLSSDEQVRSFNDWLGSLPHTYKIVVYGNMDPVTENFSFDASKALSNATAVLKDSYTIIEGYVFYGTPYTPKFCGSYQLQDFASAKRHWDTTMQSMPKVDVLITHGPPYGTGDETGGRNVGDEALRDCVDSWTYAPLLWICGHVHASHGLHMYPHPQDSVPLLNSAVWYLEGDSLGDAQPFFVELPSLRVWRNRELLHNSRL